MLFSWRKLLLVLEQRLNEETDLQADVSWLVVGCLSGLPIQ